jgi:hypothetical protein
MCTTKLKATLPLICVCMCVSSSPDNQDLRCDAEKLWEPGTHTARPGEVPIHPQQGKKRNSECYGGERRGQSMGGLTSEVVR